MPEGPSLRKWCGIAQQFTGKAITTITGTTTAFDKAAWEGSVFSTVQVYGKQMFVELSHKPCKNHEADSEDNSLWLRYHFLMWGSLHANKYKEPSRRSKTKQVPSPRMVLHFQEDEFLAFYGGSLKKVDGPCEDTGVDILSDTFDLPKAAAALLNGVPLCYSLMDQNKFAGLGNIIKNEVLYRTKMHPLELGTTLTMSQAMKIAEQVVAFTQSWMAWEKEPNGKKFNEQMMIYWKFKCPLGHPTKRGWFGDQLKRMTVWCPECQPLIKESDIYKKEIVNTKKVKRQSKDENLSSDKESFAPEKKVKKRKASSSRDHASKHKKAKRSVRVEASDNDFDESNTFELTRNALKNNRKSSTRTVKALESSEVKELKAVKVKSQRNQSVSKRKRNASTVKRELESNMSGCCKRQKLEPASVTEKGEVGTGMPLVKHSKKVLPRLNQRTKRPAANMSRNRSRNVAHSSKKEIINTDNKLSEKVSQSPNPTLGGRRSARLANKIENI